MSRSNLIGFNFCNKDVFINANLFVFLSCHIIMSCHHVSLSCQVVISYHVVMTSHVMFLSCLKGKSMTSDWIKLSFSSSIQDVEKVYYGRGIDGCTDRWKDGWTGGRICQRMDKQIDGWTNRHIKPHIKMQVRI